jgi:hypothetical protein
MHNQPQCTWIGDGEKCSNPCIENKSYCEKHYNRMYEIMPPEMADFILDKETAVKPN